MTFSSKEKSSWLWSWKKWYSIMRESVRRGETRNWRRWPTVYIRILWIHVQKCTLSFSLSFLFSGKKGFARAHTHCVYLHTYVGRFYVYNLDLALKHPHYRLIIIHDSLPSTNKVEDRHWEMWNMYANTFALVRNFPWMKICVRAS